MLRASVAAAQGELDLRGVVDPMVDPLIGAGCELRALVDAGVLRDTDERDIALDALVAAAGPDGALRAAATAGNFEMMNRLLDGIGVGPPERMLAVAPELGVAWPPT